jgi:hypothetical protein
LDQQLLHAGASWSVLMSLRTMTSPSQLKEKKAPWTWMIAYAINDAFVAIFDRDVEDYSLTVTSAGLDQPFSVLKQYLKAIGTIRSRTWSKAARK